MLPFGPYRYGNPAAMGRGFVGPLDAVSSNLVVAVSWEKRLLSSYTGPIINVLRSSDGAPQDIGYTADGSLDTAALLAFVGSGNAFCARAYRQDGNGGGDFIQGTALNQPRIVNSGVVDDGARFNGSSSFMDIASALAAAYTDGTHIQVLQTGKFTDGRNFDFGPDQIAAWNVFGGTIYMDFPQTGARLSVAAPGGYTTSYNNCSFERNGATSTIRVNGSVLTSGGIAGTISGTSILRLGAAVSGGSYFTGNIRNFVIWKDCTNAAARAALLS